MKTPNYEGVKCFGKLSFSHFPASIIAWEIEISNVCKVIDCPIGCSELSYLLFLTESNYYLLSGLILVS